MTAADRPSVTDDARAEAYRRYGTPRESDLLPSDYVTIGQIEGYVEGRLAAGRAETTTATTEDKSVIERAATVITANTDEPMWSAVVIAKEMASRGLLATARTRPTREELVIAIRDADLRYTDNGMAVTAGDYADAVLALLEGGGW